MKRHIWFIFTIVSISLVLQVIVFLLLYLKNYNFQKISKIFSIVAVVFLSIKLIFYIIFKITKFYLNKNMSNINLTDHELAQNYLNFYDNENKEYFEYLKSLKKIWLSVIVVIILNLIFAGAIAIIFSFIY